jgi:hypothetical protein
MLVGLATAKILGPGGPGFAITALVVMGVFGSICSTVLSAFGQGQIAGIVKVVTVLCCIGTLVTCAIQALKLISSGFGV